jgi:hypothetical protein
MGLDAWHGNCSIYERRTLAMLTDSTYKTRAPRFPIKAPVYYRDDCDRGWNEGTTINISRCGVLFQSPTELEPQQVVQMRILFPAELTGGAPTNVVCKATILRKEPKLSAVAASLANCRFLQAE